MFTTKDLKVISVIFAVGIFTVVNSQQECGPFEEPSDCVNCRAVCNSTIDDCVQTDCTTGCLCKEGYILDSLFGTCIPQVDCDRCGPFQTLEKGSSTCRGQICGLPLPEVCTDDDVDRCVCRKGFIWTSNSYATGECVPEGYCANCKRNEIIEFGSSSCRGPICGLPDSRICTMDIVPRCVCQPGYIFASPEGNCIPYDECKPTCRAHEEIGCGNCRSVCGAIPEPCEKICIPGCQCKSGYTLDTFGQQCITNEKCDEQVLSQQCGTFEIPATCGNCRPVCKTEIECTKECTPGCQCDRGYILDAPNGKCITNEKCGICGPNQVLEVGSSSCRGPVCGRSPPFACTDDLVPRCVCSKGFIWVITETGAQECVPEKKCLSCGDNQVIEYGSSTCRGSVCGLSDNRPCTADYVPRCVCRKGYIWTNADSGVEECVTEDSCPRCGPNQMVQYGSSTCRGPVCGITDIRLCTNDYVPRCVCNKGFIWTNTDSGVEECIPDAMCPRCGRNQIIEYGSSTCRGSVCGLSDDRPCTADYVPRCVCTKGYIWTNADSGVEECVPEEMCTRCGPNQVVQYGSSTCRGPICGLTEGRPCTDDIVPRCICSKGYIWTNADSGVEECIPENTCCGTNQILQLGSSTCRGPVCGVSRQGPCTNDYVPRCVCQEGFIFGTPDGECITEDQCRIQA